MRPCLRLFLATALATVCAVATVRPTVMADDDDGPAVRGEFIVELKPEADVGVVNRAIGGIEAPERLTPTSSVWLFRLGGSSEREDLNNIRNTDQVVAAQPNLLADFPVSYGGKIVFWTDLDAADATASASAASVEQPALGSAGLPSGDASGAGTVVAVLDTGLDASHPAFTAHIADGGYDFVDDDRSPAEDQNGVDDNDNGAVDEAFGHGTYVSGIVRLVAPDAMILPIRVLDSDGVATTWRILQGLDRAISAGADVANMSFGGRYLGEILERAVESAEGHGLLVVAAAGNSATTEHRYPAAFDGVVAATAINGRTGVAATFANTGSWIDVAAPGVGIVSAFPAGRHATWGGTSASAPVVAGALALLRELMPASAADDVVDRLTSSARPDNLPNVAAYGRIDVREATARARNQ